MAHSLWLVVVCEYHYLHNHFSDRLYYENNDICHDVIIIKPTLFIRESKKSKILEKQKNGVGTYKI